MLISRDNSGHLRLLCLSFHYRNSENTANVQTKNNTFSFINDLVDAMEANFVEICIWLCIFIIQVEFMNYYRIVFKQPEYLNTVPYVRNKLNGSVEVSQWQV